MKLPPPTPSTLSFHHLLHPQYPTINTHLLIKPYNHLPPPPHLKSPPQLRTNMYRRKEKVNDDGKEKRMKQATHQKISQLSFPTKKANPMRMNSSSSANSYNTDAKIYASALRRHRTSTGHNHFHLSPLNLEIQEVLICQVNRKILFAKSGEFISINIVQSSSNKEELHYLRDSINSLETNVEDSNSLPRQVKKRKRMKESITLKNLNSVELLKRKYLHRNKRRKIDSLTE